MAVASDQVAAVAGQPDVGHSVGGGAKATVLVAGATGLMGRHVVKALLSRGFKVRVLLRHPGQSERYHGMAGVDTVQGDVAHYRTLEGAAQGCAAVVSCLNYRWGDACGVNTVDGLFKVLADGNRSLFREASRSGAKQFVLASNLHSAQRRRDTLVFEAREEAAQAIVAVCTAAHKCCAAAAAATTAGVAASSNAVPAADAAAAAAAAATTAGVTASSNASPAAAAAGAAPNGSDAGRGSSGAALGSGLSRSEGTTQASFDTNASKQEGSQRGADAAATTPLLAQTAAQQAPSPCSALPTTSFAAQSAISYTILDFAFSHEFIERQMHVIGGRGSEAAWTCVGTEGMQRKVSPIAVADAAAKVAAVVGDESSYNTRQEVGGPEVLTWLQVATLAFAAIGRPVRVNVVPYWLFWLAWLWFSLLGLLGKPEHEMRAQHYGWTQLMYRQDSVAPACGTIHLKEHLLKAARRWRQRAADAAAVAAANATCKVQEADKTCKEEGTGGEQDGHDVEGKKDK